MTHWTDTFTNRRASRARPGGSGFRGPAGIAGILVRSVARLIDTLFLWQERAQSRYRLSQLDDRMLKDIGISRVDALHEASKPPWRR